MKYNEYFKMAIKRFPSMNIEKIPQFNRIDCLKMVTEILFIVNECDSELANETRKRLIELRENGEFKDF